MARRLVRTQSRRGTHHRHQGLPGGSGPQGGAAGAQAGPQECPRHDGHARQAVRLPLHRPRAQRALHRRRRLGRRFGQVLPRLDVPGDPADPRQDHQRREVAHRQGAEEQRGAVTDHGDGHRHPRRLRPRKAALSQDRAHGRRRRRRPAHHHAAAHAAVPVHAPADRARARLPRRPAAVQDQVEQG